VLMFFTQISMALIFLVSTLNHLITVVLALCAKQGQRYELVSSITHHGRDPHRGHYTAHAKHGSGQWFRFDDDTVTPVSVNTVLHDEAYVLFYKQV
jgi:ubiquitin carboxyl-terminal hydrolase 10